MARYVCGLWPYALSLSLCVFAIAVRLSARSNPVLPHRRRRRRGNEVIRLFGGYVDFYRWIVQMLKVDRHFNRIDPIKKSPKFFSLLNDYLLICLLQMAMSCGYFDLHGGPPGSSRNELQQPYRPRDAFRKFPAREKLPSEHGLHPKARILSWISTSTPDRNSRKAEDLVGRIVVLDPESHKSSLTFTATGETRRPPFGLKGGQFSKSTNDWAGWSARERSPPPELASFSARPTIPASLQK